MLLIKERLINTKLMIAKFKCIKTLVLIFLTFYATISFGQESESLDNSKAFKKLKFYDYRSDNVIDIAGGTSVMNGDYFTDPLFEVFFHVGYKRYIFPYLNINFGYNKFNLAYKDIFNEGFMSFDLNLEYTMLPYEKFTPYVFVGAGYNAANYFERTDMKAQAGLGVEYIVIEGLGLKLYADYNYVFTDELDGFEFGDADDVYWRIGFGINFYLGGTKKREKILAKLPTVINTNSIIEKQNWGKK
ncbi:curli production assembly/transport component CsgG [Meridianimaribacter flavus]|uniref:Curli production assembly/transport component CsgG n=2 Tax=Meridianimaribacter flavus TaxID=571115 RepID=A0ABY2G1U2_9FLAO|nr:curli production assembly/transport component CsgG [Meridianimaribacter flavus]